jgi:hypothetical protein
MSAIKQVYEAHDLLGGATETVAVGATGTAHDVSLFDAFIVQTTIASINTNTVARIEGSADGTSYFPLETDSTGVTAVNKTFTANGTYSWQYNNSNRLIKKIRYNHVSDAAGTPTHTVFVRAGRKMAGGGV